MPRLPRLDADTGDPNQPTKPTFLQNLWMNRDTIGQGLLFGADALISYNNDVNQTQDQEQRMRSTFQQKPIWDYSYMYGDNQPLIKAQEGAQIRTGGSPSLPIEIEGGEFLMLPDGDLEKAVGPKHAKGGVSTLLPRGTRIFSNKLRPKGQKFTFAHLAAKNDYTRHKKALENPFTSRYTRNAAQRMLQRQQDTLFDLFDEQQEMNGNSHGQKMESGGKTSLSTGQEIAYRKWMDTIGHTNDNGYSVDKDYNGEDYDYRGYWKEAQMSPEADRLLNIGEDQHLPDTYKLPNHETHSNESKYRQAPRNAKGFWDDNDNFVEFEVGGEYDLSQEQIDHLSSKGYQIQIL